MMEKVCQNIRHVLDYKLHALPTGYQNNVSQNNKAGNLLDFLSMSSNPPVMRRNNIDVPSPKDIPPPPPYTTTNSHPTAVNPEISWMTNYGTSPVHNSMAYLNQNLSLAAAAGASYHNSEHNKSNLNSIQPFLDSDLAVPNLDYFSSVADTEKFLSTSM